MAGARSVTFAVDVDAPILRARHPIIGDSPSGVAEPGTEPVKVGGVYRASPPALTDGWRGDLLLDSRENLKVAIVGQNSNLGPTAGTLGEGIALTLPGLYTLAFNYLFNGATMDKQRVPTVFKPFASTAITAGTGATIWTPAAGKKFRLMGWLISSSVAGQLIFGDNLVATVIARSEAVAAAGVSKAGAADIGNGLLSALANNVLKLDGPTGNVAGMVWGTEE